jgi:hypothetical protein
MFPQVLEIIIKAIFHNFLGLVWFGYFSLIHSKAINNIEKKNRLAFVLAWKGIN